MKKVILMFCVLIALSSCGKVPVEVTGSVDVNHNIQIDDLYDFFLDQCEGDYECANQRLAEFLGYLGNQ